MTKCLPQADYMKLTVFYFVKRLLITYLRRAKGRKFWSCLTLTYTVALGTKSTPESTKYDRIV